MENVNDYDVQTDEKTGREETFGLFITPVSKVSNVFLFFALTTLELFIEF